MRCQARFTITFNARSVTNARSVALAHFQQVLDDLRIEGVDHPCNFSLDSLSADGFDVSIAAQSEDI